MLNFVGVIISKIHNFWQFRWVLNFKFPASFLKFQKRPRLKAATETAMQMEMIFPLLDGLAGGGVGAAAAMNVLEEVREDELL